MLPDADSSAIHTTRYSMPRKKQVPQFETALAELEQLVARMESGELSLEQSLAAFEQGVKLSHDCQQALTEAQQKVAMLQAESTQSQTPSEDNAQ